MQTACGVRIYKSDVKNICCKPFSCSSNFVLTAAKLTVGLKKYRFNFSDYVWFLTFQFEFFIFHPIRINVYEWNFFFTLSWLHFLLDFANMVSFASSFPFQGIFISLFFNVRAKFHNFSMCFHTITFTCTHIELAREKIILQMKKNNMKI